jgi:murein DD-endopeptidase MepM/ murein hydrolase activator NlpD
MKKIFLILLMPFFLFGYQIQIVKWKKFGTFYSFLKKNDIKFSFYYTLNKKIRKDLVHIPMDSEIYLLKNGTTLKQALIPLNTEKQLQLINNKGKIITKIVPIHYDIQQKYTSINISHFLSYDVYQATRNPAISKKLVSIFSDRINFKLLPKNTEIELYYTLKSRFGKISSIDIKYASIKNRFYQISAYKWSDGRYYDSEGRSLKGMFLSTPLRYKRISSYFGMRLHPILHKWRMHDGIDFVNKIGTPIHAVADGKIIYKGWMRGYGNVVEIKHKEGYTTLYGHMKGFANIRVGQYVKQGKTIGYLGNTGLSTGPHLHFGVLHYGKWINPLKIRKSARIILRGYKKKKFFAFVQNLNKSLSNKVALK